MIALSITSQCSTERKNTDDSFCLGLALWITLAVFRVVNKYVAYYFGQGNIARSVQILRFSEFMQKILIEVVTVF
jgi:hypothetical protein